MVTGYLITAIILSCGGSWTWSFFLQVILLVPIAIYIASIGSRFLDLVKREPALSDQAGEETDDANNAALTAPTDIKEYLYRQAYKKRI